MKRIFTVIAVLLIFALPASSMALPIAYDENSDGPTCQATAWDIPTDHILDILFEMIVMCVNMHDDIDDINAIGVVDFFETMAMATGGSTEGYHFHCTRGDVVAPMESIAGTAAAPAPEPAIMALLGTGLLGLALAGRRKLRKIQT